MTDTNQQLPQTPPPLERQLSYKDRDGKEAIIHQSALLTLPMPIVVLGEPGSGKSTLLNSLAAANGIKPITAKQFLRHPNSFPDDQSILFIDALDELATAKESDGLGRILEKLNALECPPFLLTCRSAEWQGVGAAYDIEQDYKISPTIVQIERLSRVDALAFLRPRLLKTEPEELIKFLSSQNLESLSANPLTLSLLADVANSTETLPNSRADLFDTACNLLWKEAMPERGRSPLGKMTRDDALNAAGAICAVHILTNADAISLKSPAWLDEGDCSIREIEKLPLGTSAPTLLNSRLFVPIGPAGDQRFAPLHRVIAEFLGARWLAKFIDDGLSRYRILSMLTLNGTVPASLRGLHAWIAYYCPHAADEVITNDPYGVLRYGDASRLTVPMWRTLLNALDGLSETDPYFRASDWGELSVQGLAKLELLQDITLLLDRSRNFHLRDIILECIQGSVLAKPMAPRLRALMMDESGSYSERKQAAAALADTISTTEWLSILALLRSSPEKSSTRLALDLLCEHDISALGDQEITASILSYYGYLLCPVDQSRQWTKQPFGSMWRLADKLPESRLPAILDCLAEYRPFIASDKEWERRRELSDFVLQAIYKAVNPTTIQACRIWNWLRLLDSSDGRGRDSVKQLATYFEMNSSLRREIQRYALANDPSESTVWMRAWKLGQLLPSLIPSHDDILVFLDEMGDLDNPAEKDREAWQDLLRLSRSRDGLSAETICVARRFAKKDRKLLAFLRQTSKPIVNKWEKKEAERNRKAEFEKNARWNKQREDFSRNIDALKAGELRWILPAAQFYLALFNDSDKEKSPYDRIQEWLGDELAHAVTVGFEAVLRRKDLPTPETVAIDYTENRRWNMVYPIVAALAGRIHGNRDFIDIPRDIARTAWLALHHESYLEQHADIQDFTEKLEIALSHDIVAFEEDYRLLIQTQLKARTQHICGLYRLVRSDSLRGIAKVLATEWLVAHRDLSVSTEIELVDCLISNSELGALERLWQSNLTAEGIEGDRRALWLSVGFVVDFPEFRSVAENSRAWDKTLLWSIRGRLHRDDRPRRSGKYPRCVASAEQIGWVVQTFRALWPRKSHPSSGWAGDTNPWDATEFLQDMINELAADLSLDAAEVMIDLRDAPADDYTHYIRHAAARQRRARDETQFESITIDRLTAVIRNESPQSIDDLQAVICECLNIIQAKFRGSETDPLEAFYDKDGRPRDESFCTKRILEWLKSELPPGVLVTREPRMPADKRSDFAFFSGELLVPTEVKCQWNKDVWDAATSQLDQLYTKEHRAFGRGIYVALWFGNVTDRTKRLASPPPGISVPTSAEEMKAILVERIPEARRGQLAVVVLDLEK